MAGSNGSNGNGAKVGTDKVKQGLAQMLKGGVIVSYDWCVDVLLFVGWMHVCALYGGGDDGDCNRYNLCAYDMYIYWVCRYESSISYIEIDGHHHYISIPIVEASSYCR